MTLAACCMSHSPLLEPTDPGPELIADVEKAFAAARDFVRDYDPALVIVLARTTGRSRNSSQASASSPRLLHRRRVSPADAQLATSASPRSSRDRFPPEGPDDMNVHQAIQTQPMERLQV
jgi:hypothetical protein